MTPQELHNRLLEINLDDVPVMATDRHIPRKEQAALARKLFKQLGLKGIGVTTPKYSMASTVDVKPPRRTDWVLENGSIDVECPASQMNHDIEKRLLLVIAKAFPNHDDRSDSQTDYFDSKWSFTH